VPWCTAADATSEASADIADAFAFNETTLLLIIEDSNGPFDARWNLALKKKLLHSMTSGRGT
jgi:hypothetical protein